MTDTTLTNGWIRLRSPDGTEEITTELRGELQAELEAAGWQWRGHFQGFSEDDRRRAREVYGDSAQIVLDAHEQRTRESLG